MPRFNRVLNSLPRVSLPAPPGVPPDQRVPRKDLFAHPRNICFRTELTRASLENTPSQEHDAMRMTRCLGLTDKSAPQNNIPRQRENEWIRSGRERHLLLIPHSHTGHIMNGDKVVFYPMGEHQVNARDVLSNLVSHTHTPKLMRPHFPFVVMLVSQRLPR